MTGIPAVDAFAIAIAVFSALGAVASRYDRRRDAQLLRTSRIHRQRHSDYR